MKERLKQIAKFWAGVALVFSPIWVAHLAWRLQPPSARTVAVVDYTVPFENYQIHTALMWMMNYAKVEPPAGSDEWRPERDYIGYDPTDRLNPTRLSDVDLAEVDTIYLADAYGVYDADLVAENLLTWTPHLTWSRLRFGGVVADDLAAIDAHLLGGGDLIAEFNVLAPPTPDGVSGRLQDALGVRWTGWTGRVFPDLTDPADVPDWLIELFPATYPDREMPDEPSLVLVSKDAELIVLTMPGLADVVPTIRTTSMGRDRFGRIRSDAPYFGWFALVEQGEGALTYATFHLPEALRDEERFGPSGLGLEYAAVTERLVGASNRLYFCWDASNLDDAPDAYSIAHVERVQALVHRRHDFWSAQPAFWQVYAPMVRRFLREDP